MDALLPVALHVHPGVVDVKGRNPQRDANGDREDGRRPQEFGSTGQQAGDGAPTVHISSDGDPSPGRSEAEAKPQPEVAPHVKRFMYG